MNLDFYLKDIVFFEGTCYTCDEHCGKTINCTNNFDTLTAKVRSLCEDLLGNCTWNGVEFDCCKSFLPLHTEVGYCFIINSLQTQKPKGYEEVDMISNSDLGPGRLDFYLYESAKVYIHSAEDVPFANHPQEEKSIVPWGYSFVMKFQVSEIVNDKGLKSLSVNQRNCYFPDENPLPLYPSYSYSACIVSCRADYQQQLCNCSNHLLPRIHKLKSLQSQKGSQEGIVCDCFSSCTEPEYKILSSELERSEESDGSKVSLLLEFIPNRRFKRNIVRSSLDLVVSIGGAVGLFFGGSILSFVEFYYFLFLKKYSKETPRNVNLIHVQNQIINVNRIRFQYPRNVLIS